MNYKALYRTYRPTTFDDVVGQDHITTTLKNVIENNKIGHAYLFAGPRGTGKTSVAHVFAREVNRNAAGIETFSDLDIIEIDAASNNGVDDARNIIDGSKYAPTSAKYKVYIIDEVHMLTKGAFNALLKTLEEPSANVIFILATTEAHKVPVTILSRCQRFNFRRIDEATISKRLIEVLKKENIQYDDEAIKLIAKISHGGMRDALSIADQASSFSGKLTFVSLSQLFGVVAIENQIKILDFAFNNETKLLMHLINNLIENGVNTEILTILLLDILKDFIIFKKTGDSSLLTTITQEHIMKLKWTLSFAYNTVDILVKLLGDLKFSDAPIQTFELAILKTTSSDKVVTPMVKQAETQEINIFKTEELEVEKPVQEEALPDKEPEVKEEVDISDFEKIIEETGEFKIANDLISSEEESAQQTSTIDESLLNNDPDVEDLVGLFSEEPKTDTAEVETPNHSVIDKVINLLVQADKNLIKKYKVMMEDLMLHANDLGVGKFVMNLEKTKIISSGENFILIGAESKELIEEINHDSKNPKFLELIKTIFGEPLNVFAITKVQFEEVKEIWAQLARSGMLPKPVPIQKNEITSRKSEAEELGTKLFGDLFKV